MTIHIYLLLMIRHIIIIDGRQALAEISWAVSQVNETHVRHGARDVYAPPRAQPPQQQYSMRSNLCMRTRMQLGMVYVLIIYISGFAYQCID
jgi:hypothetical protein